MSRKTAGAAKAAPDEGGRPGRRDSRREHLLQCAADLFAQKGFEATTIRDIAQAADILPGSIYYHFASKEDVAVAVHERGIEDFLANLETALAGLDDPWTRLEAAAVSHLTTLTGRSPFAAVVNPEFARRATLHAPLIKQRDRYESAVRSLVDDLDLAPDVDRSLFRLHLLGALNWSVHWFKPARRPAKDVAVEMIRYLRDGARAPGTRA